GGYRAEQHAVARTKPRHGVVVGVRDPHGCAVERDADRARPDRERAEDGPIAGADLPHDAVTVARHPDVGAVARYPGGIHAGRDLEPGAVRVVPAEGGDAQRVQAYPGHPLRAGGAGGTGWTRSPHGTGGAGCTSRANGSRRTSDTGRPHRSRGAHVALRSARTDRTVRADGARLTL